MTTPHDRLLAMLRREDARREDARRAKRGKPPRRPRRKPRADWARLREAWDHHFAAATAPVPAWGHAERAVITAVIQDIGLIRAEEALRYYLDTWEERRWEPIPPSVHLFRHCLPQLLAELNGEVPRLLNKRARMNRDEWDPGKAALSPKVGWGDL